jgi:small subunit ribosomal protein S6
MALYEHIFLARQDISAQQMEALTDHWKEVLKTNGGSVEKVEQWGLKTLPYKIAKNRKAHYALLNVSAPAGALFEMERQMRIHEDVIRYMTIRVEEHEDGPSAMMRKSDRDDRRGDRGDRNDRPPRGNREEKSNSKSEGA